MLASLWADFDASHDPVPSAPLKTTFNLNSILSMEIENRRSYLADHTSYFGNFAEFVFPRCHLLTGYAGLPEPSAEIQVDAKTLIWHHHRMVRLYQTTFYAVPLLVAMGVVESAGDGSLAPVRPAL